MGPDVKRKFRFCTDIAVMPISLAPKPGAEMGPIEISASPSVSRRGQKSEFPHKMSDMRHKIAWTVGVSYIGKGSENRMPHEA